MGRSMVLTAPSILSMSDWERNARSSLNRSNSDISNHDTSQEDDEVEGAERAPSTQRATWGTAHSELFHASMHGHRHAASLSSARTPGEYEHGRYYTRSHTERLRSPEDVYSRSHVYGRGEEVTKLAEDADDDQEDRKPAARGVPSAHRGRHSLSDDPFAPPREASADRYTRQSEVTVQDPFINPTMSFSDDEMPTQSQGTYDVEALADAEDTAHHPTSYAARVPSYPEPRVYKIGDGPFARHEYPVASMGPAFLQDQESPSLVEARSRPRRNYSHYRRTATAQELESATSDRARAAISTWYSRYNELIDYLEINGDCNVPQKYPENPQLGIWVNKQRMEKKFMDEGKKSSMTENKIDCLEAIGFTWAKRKGEASWMLKYNELRQFKAQFGHCNVATKYSPNPALGRWVSTQRSEYKVFQKKGSAKHISQRKIDMLNELGFKWEMLPTNKGSSPSNSSNATSSSGGED